MESNDQAPAPQSGATPPGAPGAAPQTPAAGATPADTPPADTAPADTAPTDTTPAGPPPTAEAPAGGYPPPGNTAPPPGAQVPPPGPQPTGARPLYRTREPRIIAGVCGGLARATNTDPILFRVILAVLVFFGGIGALLYLLGWLLLPLEGETASPVEALLGRGQSSTSPVITMLLAAVAVIALAASLNSGFENVVLLAAVIIGVVLLLRRTGHLPENLGFPPRPAAAAGPTQYSAPAPPTYGTSAYSAPAGPGTTATLQIPTSPPQPPTSGPGAYSSPFAPHGPYVPPIPPRPPIPPVPPPPRPPKERSILGRITFAVVCLALAGVTLIDLAGADVPFSGYAATALGVTALGLVVGAWFGRARLLIVLGIALSIALAVGTASERIGKYTNIDEQVSWRPMTVEQLQRDYRLDAGDATLDLTTLDFTDRSRDVSVELGAGDLRVYLPPNVDVDVRAKVGVGDAQIFEGRSEGLGIDRHGSDNGVDGPGGGTLNLTVDVGVGSLEVTR
jgi:phage shock protein PspC (stress-responsive transcriptional regulator)